MVPESLLTRHMVGAICAYIFQQKSGAKGDILSRNTYINYRMRHRPWPRMYFVCLSTDHAKMLFQTFNPNSPLSRSLASTIEASIASKRTFNVSGDIPLTFSAVYGYPCSTVPRPRIAALHIRLRRLVSRALRVKPLSVLAYWVSRYLGLSEAFLRSELTFPWFQVSKQKAWRFFNVSSRSPFVFSPWCPFTLGAFLLLVCTPCWVQMSFGLPDRWAWPQIYI
jgi:hypothetical protein